MMMKRLSALLGLFLFTTAYGFAQSRNYWQQHADYTMNIDMNVETNRFTGTQKIVYTNNSPDEIHKAFYHLYFNAFQPGSMMDVRSRTIADPDGRVRDRILKLKPEEIGYQKVKSLKQDGKEVRFFEDETILEVRLHTPVKPGQKTVLEMEFEAQVPIQIRRSGRDNAEGVRYSMTQWYPKLAEYDYMGWHPNPYIAREFYGVWGSFDVTINIDSSYVIGATGTLQNPEQIGHGYSRGNKPLRRPSGSKLSWNFKANNVHDFAWGADPDFTHTTIQVPDGPLVHFFYQKDTVAENFPEENQAQLRENWENLREMTSKAFQFANKEFGKYPYSDFSVIQGGDGGMEYPMATLITGGRNFNSLVGVTVHEMFHSWYQGVLGTNESLYAFMDEGFTSYASSRTMAHLFNREGDPHQGAYRGYRAVVAAGMEEAMDFHADHYNTNRGYSTGSYTKGEVFLHQLSYIIGLETFNRGMKRYFDTWKFKHPNADDFIRVMEKESDLILDWYDDYFIKTTKTIDYGIANVEQVNESTYVTLQRIGSMPMPIELEVEYTDGSRELFYAPLRIMRGEKKPENDTKRTLLPDWPWTNPTYQFEIPVPQSRIKVLRIDPSLRLADINPENNTKEF